MNTMATALKPCAHPASAARTRLVGRGSTVAVGEHALVDLDDAGIELLGLDDLLGENLRPRLIADLQRVAKAARRHQQRALAARSSSALVATVVPILTKPMAPSGIGAPAASPSRRRIASTAASS